MPAPYATHRAQIKAILTAWGMPEENAEATADILSWADLHGVDSHGMSMIPGYDRLRRAGRLLVLDPVDKLLARDGLDELGMALPDVLLDLLDHLAGGLPAERAAALAIDQLRHGCFLQSRGCWGL